MKSRVLSITCISGTKLKIFLTASLRQCKSLGDPEYCYSTALNKSITSAMQCSPQTIIDKKLLILGGDHSLYFQDLYT